MALSECPPTTVPPGAPHLVRRTLRIPAEVAGGTGSLGCRAALGQPQPAHQNRNLTKAPGFGKTATRKMS
eukprot:CAMPEP_0197900586 /NCGR_PEP_ID=MMETSP1439-20131203/49421_1 /TAXON_ID=66791 /ORGANISM="Gonyaulax spinifera, Strain CCMP409" /LENGTH=69 /DNA_ID=CAMNT_0043521485 /DNA_START=39 /DNA_END=245 /DNA_ORIENTATION=-